MEKISNFKEKLKEKFSNLTLKQALIQFLQVLKNYQLLISLLIAIILPWILTSIFIYYLRLTHGLADELTEDPGLLFRMTIFYSFTLPYELPILGFGYSLCMIVWAATGLFTGLFTRDMDKSLGSALIGLGMTFLLYLLLIFVPDPTFPKDMEIHYLIYTRLYSDLTGDHAYFLLFFVLFHSFAFPVLILFTLIGSMLNPKPKPYQIPFEEESQTTEPKIKKESKSITESDITEDNNLPTLWMLEEEEGKEASVQEKKRLKGFTGVISKQLMPLNSNERYKENYKNTSLKILLNPIDQMNAALIKMEKGTIEVDEIEKQYPLMEMNKKQIGYDAMLQVTTQMILDITTGKMTIARLLKTAVKDKNIKVKGKLKLLKLLKAFTLL